MAEMNFDYDKEGDILYITLGSPKEGVYHEIKEDVFVRFSEDKKIIGCMILHFEKHLKQKNNALHIPLDVSFTLNNIAV